MMERNIHEASRSVPVLAAADVVVAGGGIAGAAAALAARRAGASVLLLEKTVGIGGLATLGNVTIFLPLCDGRGRQVIGGLGEELLRLSVARVEAPVESMRIDRVPACWESGGNREERRRHRFRVGYNPVDFQLDLEALLEREGVSLSFDTLCCGVVRAGRRVTALLVETKAGRFAVTGRAFVDATGDADLCARAGEPLVSLDTNVPCAWFYTYDPQAGVLRQHPMTNPYDPAGGLPPDGGPAFAGDSAAAVTGQILASRRCLRERVAAARAASGHELLPVHIPSVACLRMTRRLRGKVELREEHSHHFFEDATGMTGDWRRSGPVYSLPLAMLTAVKHDNLLVAGRCVSATGGAWDVVRAIPTCVVTGQAAGTAAAMAAAGPGAVCRIPIGDLQERLRQAGVPIDRSLALPG